MEADKNEEDQVDTEMADAAPADEPEVQSPLKKAPAPEASADKPSTAAGSGGAPSSRAKLVVKPAGESGGTNMLGAVCSLCCVTSNLPSGSFVDCGTGSRLDPAGERVTEETET
jgi:hypothetical protein